MLALEKVNNGYVTSYGEDETMVQCVKQVREIFENDSAEVFLVSTGTAANGLAISCVCSPWQTIYCHKESHIELEECGAPEFYTGGSKLTLLGGENGKINPFELENKLKFSSPAGVHSVQKGVLSITNSTESGTVYTPIEIKELSKIAKKFNIPIHMDGTRFANAVLTNKTSPSELSWKAGVNILSLGGTKNGLLAAEAVIMFDPEKAWELELRRKRSGHLISKHRFLSAQMNAYFDNNLWLKLAQNSNYMAQKLSNGLTKIPGVFIDQPTQSNAVFASLPRFLHEKIRNSGAKYYYWPHDPEQTGPKGELIPARFVCSWSTTETEINQLLSSISNSSI
jgi:threonine aldolase